MGSITANFHSAPIKCSPRVAENGQLVLVPDVVAEWYEAQGGGWLKIWIPGRKDLETNKWLTLKDAAMLYWEDRPDLASLSSAKGIISRACKNGIISHVGTNRGLRINPSAFDSWRLKKRDSFYKTLDKLDESG